MSKFWEELLHQSDDLPVQDVVIKSLFKQPNVLQELQVLDEEAQKLILMKILQNDAGDIFIHEEVLKFAFQHFGIEILQALNQPDMSGVFISSNLIKVMLAACHTSKIWDLYFHIIDIPFSSSGNHARFFEDLKNPENEAALQHIAIFLIPYARGDVILVKKAIRLALRDYPSQLKAMIQKNEELQRLTFSMMLEESTSFEDWDRYFKIFQDGEDFAKLIQDLNKSEDRGALKHLLSSILAHSKMRRVLQDNIQHIPMDSIILLDVHENFKNHPLYDVFFIKPNWNSLFRERMAILLEFNPQAIKKLFQLSHENPLLAAINSGDIQATRWVLASLLKLEDLVYSNKILEGFLDSKQKITTENVDILKLFIKLLLDNPKQKTVLKTVKDKCNTSLKMSNVLITLKDECNEDELYRLLTEDFTDGRTLFMEGIYSKDSSTSIGLLDIIKTMTKSNGEMRSQIFSQTSQFGNNALMIAAINQPTAVPEILKAIVEIKDTGLMVSVLSQTEKNDYNALMLAADYQPDVVPDILETVLNFLDVKAQKDILECGSNKWINAYKAKQKLSINTLLKLSFHHPAIYQELEINNSIINSIVIKPYLMGKKSLNWAKFITEFRQDFDKIDPHILTLPPNILIELAKLNNDEDLIFILKKFQDLQTLDPQGVNQIIQAFIVSKQKIITENTDILKLFIKLLLGNPEQKTVLKTVKDKCNTSVKISNVLITLKDELNEDELYRLLTEDFTDGRTLFMEELYEGDGSTLLDIIMTITKNNGEKRSQILSQTDLYGYNSLMLAAQYQPDAVTPILDALFETKDSKLIFEVLSQKNLWSRNALMIAAQYQPKNVSAIIEALFKTENKDLKVSVFRQTDHFKENVLMIAAQEQPDAVTPILDALFETKDSKLIFEVLSQKNLWSRNALMIAAQYQPKNVSAIIEALFKTENKDLISSILSQTSQYGCNALMLAARYQPKAVPNILKAIGSLDCSEQTKILMQAYNNCNNIALSYRDFLTKKPITYIQWIKPEWLMPYFKGIFKYQIERSDYNPQFKIKVEDAHFNIMQGIYHLHGWLRENQKTLNPLHFTQLKAFIKDLIESDNIPIEPSEILIRLRSLASNIKNLKTHQIILDLEQAMMAYQIENIPWPETEIYQCIKDKKSIDSIAHTLKPLWLMKNFVDFKPIFKTFPEDWKNRYLHQCQIELKPESYREIFGKLQSIDSMETLLANMKDTAPSAPPSPVAKPSDDDSLIIAQAAYVSPNSENKVESEVNTVDIAVEVFSEFWINVKGMTEEYFIYEFQALDDIETIYAFINYMRTPSWWGPVYRNAQNIREWIEKNPENRKQFHLYELTYFAKHYEHLANQIKDSASPKKTALMNLSMDLLKFQEGIRLIYRQIKETQHDDSYQNKLKIYQIHLEFLRHYLDRFEKFKKNYPGVMDFTSSLLLPNGAYAHTLVELSLRKPVPPIEKKTWSKPHDSENQALLISRIKDETKKFVAQIKEKSNVPAFFIATEGSSHKNLLILALETKDIEKINAVAQTIYEFDEGERTNILETCNQKGYRLTSYIRQKDPYLCLLELERLVLKLEKLNSSDPNIRILKDLAIHLRTNPNDYLSDIEQARIDIRKNSSWRQWFSGGYSKTDYGIGIFKETIEGLLSKIENTMGTLSPKNN